MRALLCIFAVSMVQLLTCRKRGDWCSFVFATMLGITFTLSFFRVCVIAAYVCVNTAVPADTVLKLCALCWPVPHFQCCCVITLVVFILFNYIIQKCCFCTNLFLHLVPAHICYSDCVVT